MIKINCICHCTFCLHSVLLLQNVGQKTKKPKQTIKSCILMAKSDCACESELFNCTFLTAFKQFISNVS